VDSMLHEYLINIAIFHVIEEFLDVSLHLLVDSDRLYVLLWGHQRAVRGPSTCLLRVLLWGHQRAVRGPSTCLLRRLDCTYSRTPYKSIDACDGGSPLRQGQLLCWLQRSSTCIGSKRLLRDCGSTNKGRRGCHDSVI
jgi:hypothetical protein